MKPPAFPLYVRDFLVDTALLSTEEVGAYILLLCYAWIGIPGSIQAELPEDNSKLATLSRISQRRAKVVLPPVVALFRKDDKTGALYSRRLREELEIQRERSEKAARSSGFRWQPKTDANALPTDTERKVGALPSESFAVAVASAVAVAGKDLPTPPPPSLPSPAKPARVAKVNHEKDPDFLRFWESYPRKVAKKDAAKAWGQANGSRPPLSELLAAVDRQSRSSQWTRDNGDAIPYPATWLRGERWGDALGAKIRPPAVPPEQLLSDARLDVLDAMARSLRAGEIDQDRFDAGSRAIDAAKTADEALRVGMPFAKPATANFAEVTSGA